jgi:hypothetical protein
MKRRSGKSIFAISIFVLLPYKKCKPSLRTVVNHVPGLYTLPRAEFFDAFSVGVSLLLESGLKCVSVI